MARPRKIDPGLVKQAQLLASRTDDIQELRMAQAVLLPALGQMTLQAAAKVIGVGRATVARLQTMFRTPRRWGGRRRALMKLEEEQGLSVRLETPGRARPIGGRDAAAPRVEGRADCAA